MLKKNNFNKRWKINKNQCNPILIIRRNNWKINYKNKKRNFKKSQINKDKLYYSRNRKSKMI